ncbi:MAG: hypothetical protein FJ090_12045 [Deltaproteobacteria bacterium]|nr:hypothetical protein [Deltaproteobacteria bacterium]
MRQARDGVGLVEAVGAALLRLVEVGQRPPGVVAGQLALGQAEEAHGALLGVAVERRVHVAGLVHAAGGEEGLAADLRGGERVAGVDDRELGQGRQRARRVVLSEPHAGLAHAPGCLELGGDTGREKVVRGGGLVVPAEALEREPALLRGPGVAVGVEQS